CAEVCPHDLSMAPVCMEGRVGLVDRNKMPPSAHDFALEDMRSSNSEKSALALHEPGRDQSAFVFFAGCQLGAAYPDHIVHSYAYLRKILKGGVGLMLRCCGAPAQWAGRVDLFKGSIMDISRDWERLGRPVIITACPTCHQILKGHLPYARFTTLWHILESTEAVDRKRPCATLAIHDPCTTRHEPAMQQSVRRILTRSGYAIEELELSGDRTECCGFGGLMSASNPPLARDVAKTRASRSETDYVTYCAMCRNALAASGKRVVYILDLLFGGETDPASRRVPGLSERHENRYRLKQRLLKELWGTREGKMDDYEKITLHISPEVQKVMEERRILIEDAQKVIDHAEKSGVKLFNPDLGHWLASFKPAHVTYWVEYSPEEAGFSVHNAYCHRMEVVGNAGS
ncbi:MAG: pyridine nucleotide-disulfide oxidoreductase/dicluster-binding protein, partial [Syntrophorhabdales bacterium]